MSENVVNLNYLEELTGGNEEFMVEMVTIFIDQVENEFIPDFQTYWKEQNWMEIAALAHKAKSSVNTLGMNTLGNTHMKDLELIAKQARHKELKGKDVLNETEQKHLEKIKNTFDNFDDDQRLEELKKKAQDTSTIKELIDIFEKDCKLAVQELKSKFNL